MHDLPIALAELYLARRRLSGRVQRTPLVTSPALAKRVGGSVHLKLECLQITGSFKVRGALNTILALSEDRRPAGVVTFSTGNHGKAVAFAARECGIPAVVCLSQHVPAYRVEAIAACGGQVEVQGKSQDEAEEHSLRLERDRKLVPLKPFDDPRVVAGQGTIGLEILEDLPCVDTVLVPLSGGGLLSGIALALKSANPALRVIAVSAERSAVTQASVQAGRVVAVEERDTLADSLLGGIGRENRYTLRMVSALTDEFVTVSEKEIAAGMRFALEEHGVVVEGGGAVGIGAILAGKLGNAGRAVVVIVSGGSVDLPRYLRVVTGAGRRGGASRRAR